MSLTAEVFAVSAHEKTNHFYDTYLPYEFHLRMVEKTAEKFKHLISPEFVKPVFDACWLHDTIEDCRINYNEINQAFGSFAAEIVRACTNYGRGRNRRERMPQECYIDIRNTPYATFVKLCDRIANVQYSKMTGSRMLALYRDEQKHFAEQLYVSDDFKEMWEYLDGIFND